MSQKAFSDDQGAPGGATLKGRTLFITGASRGIGLAIALRAARDGANVVIAAKSAEAHPRLPGTIFTAAAQIQEAGGEALPLAVDVRQDEQVAAAFEQAVARFGGIDVLVNNASAISLTDTAHTPMKRFDLMHQVNVRGTFLCSKLCEPHLARSPNPHILTLCPPPELAERWFAPHLAYSLSKYGMSLCVLGLAGELRSRGIAVNALWPRTIVATAALQVAIAGLGDEQLRRARIPEIMADAAHVILSRPSRQFSGHFCIDEEVLRSVGETDFSRYRPQGVSEDQLLPDLFL
jgi:citronellol/citronellal dehydrogenase